MTYRMSIICDGCGASLKSEHDDPDQAIGMLRQQIREKGWVCPPIRVMYPHQADIIEEPKGTGDETLYQSGRRDLCQRCAGASAEASP